MTASRSAEQPAAADGEARPSGGATRIPLVGRVLRSPITFWAVLAVTTGLLVAAGAFTPQRQPLDADERLYLRVIEQFRSGVDLAFLRDYGGLPASPAPLFFYVYAGVGALFGGRWEVYSAFSYGLTLLSVVAIWIYGRRAQRRGADSYFPLLLLLFPYVLAMSVSVMAEPLTMFLTTGGLLAYARGLRRREDRWLLVGSLLVAAAMYVRIHALFVVGALGWVLLVQRDVSWRRWALVLLPLALRLPLVLWQGGLTVDRSAHPGVRPELGLALENLSFFFVWFGYLFFPLVGWLRQRWRWSLLGVGLLLPVYFAFAPDFTSTAHSGALRSILLAQGIGSGTAFWLFLPAWAVGAFLSLQLAQYAVGAEGRERQLAAAGVLLFALSLLASSVAFERYYQLAVVPLVMLGLPNRSAQLPYLLLAGIHGLFVALSVFRLAEMLPGL